MNNSIIKIGLAIALFLCLFNMPYGYYQFVRFISMCGFAYLAYSSNEVNKKNEAFVYIGLAILFQPFIKIALDRTIWNVVDLIVGIGLIGHYSKVNEEIIRNHYLIHLHKILV